MTVTLLLLLCGILILLLAVLFILYRYGNQSRNDNAARELTQSVQRLEQLIRDEFRNNRDESRALNKENRDETAAANKENREELKKSITDFSASFNQGIESFNKLQREKFTELEQRQQRLVESTERKLEEMRVMVDEKLQKTLNERLGQSFKMVSTQLESVQKGLGEMQNLAQDVGGLKKVLSNVKTRGNIGEIQLSMLLDQVLAPEQYCANFKVGSDFVEFAIKLPGNDDNDTPVYLPIDAKFPKDVYEQHIEAVENGTPEEIEKTSKMLESTIRKMAKDIHEKYVSPPVTTDFAILFLPFESLYADIIRRSSLLEDLMRTHKIVVTGPTTLAAILNSLQMGFRTLAIQKRSSEVWSVLNTVRKEFEKFGGILEKAQKNLHTASNQLDEVIGRRTKAIQRSLRRVEQESHETAAIDFSDPLFLTDSEEEEPEEN